MRILGFQKTTLLDYPHKLASTIFVGGCNFRCPFCHNALIVNQDKSVDKISVESVYTYLKKRVGLLDGVCITGGEPTLYPDLADFIHSIKELGYSIKLDTNGSNPNMLSQLIHHRLVDYVAMDIKNSPNKYSLTSGCNVNINDITQSIQILLNSSISYEFRTTIMKEFHDRSDFQAIAQWLHGAQQYFLQSFLPSEHLISLKPFTSYSKKELESFLSLFYGHITSVSIRGMD